MRNHGHILALIKNHQKGIDSGLEGKLVNLAIAADCEVTDVSATIVRKKDEQ